MGQSKHLMSDSCYLLLLLLLLPLLGVSYLFVELNCSRFQDTKRPFGVRP